MAKDYCVKNKETGKWDRLLSIGINDYGSPQITIGPKDKIALRAMLASDDWSNVAIFENADEKKPVQAATPTAVTPPADNNLDDEIAF